VKVFIAKVSHCVRAVSVNADAEETHAINSAMKKLYVEGCRRLRTVRLARNGDGDRFMVMGWPA